MKADWKNLVHELASVYTFTLLLDQHWAVMVEKCGGPSSVWFSGSVFDFERRFVPSVWQTRRQTGLPAAGTVWLSLDSRVWHVAVAKELVVFLLTYEKPTAVLGRDNVDDTFVSFLKHVLSRRVNSYPFN